MSLAGAVRWMLSSRIFTSTVSVGAPGMANSTISLWLSLSAYATVLGATLIRSSDILAPLSRTYYTRVPGQGPPPQRSCAPPFPLLPLKSGRLGNRRTEKGGGGRPFRFGRPDRLRPLALRQSCGRSNWKPQKSPLLEFPPPLSRGPSTPADTQCGCKLPRPLSCPRSCFLQLASVPGRLRSPHHGTPSACGAAGQSLSRQCG